MNIEQIEHELFKLRGQLVFIIVPQHGRSSISMAGPLEVVTTEEHSVGFHITGMGWAYIFFADDVQVLEPSKTEKFAITIRIGKKA